MSDQQTRGLQLNLTRFFKAWFEILQSEEPRRGDFTKMMFFAVGVAELLGKKQFEYLIEDATATWEGWPEHTFEEPDPDSFPNPVPIEHILETLAMTEIKLAIPLFDVLSPNLVVRWQERLGQTMTPERNDLERESAEVIARGIQGYLSGALEFFRVWFALLSESKPRDGAFVRMLVMAISNFDVLGRERLVDLFKGAEPTWMSWPDNAFDAPGIDSGLFDGGVVEQEVLLSMLVDKDLSRRFPLTELLPGEVLARWLPDVSLRAVGDEPGVAHVPDTASPTTWGDRHDKTRFSSMVDSIDTVEHLLLGLELTNEHLAFCSSGYTALIEDLHLAMWCRLDHLAREGKRVILPSALVEMLLQNQRLAYWPYLFGSASGVELDGLKLFSSYTLSGGRAPVVAATIKESCNIDRAMTPALERLALVDCEEKTLATFFERKSEVPDLRELNIQGGKLAGAKIVEEISTGGAFSKLERLRLSGLELEDRALEMLGESAFQWLRGLDLEDNPRVSGKGLATLFSHWKFSELEELCLDGNPADRILAIGDATYSSSLRSLVARRCTVAPDVARELSQMTGFESLQSLDLSSNALGVEGATAIAAWPRLRRLTSLSLQNARVRDEGARVIANSVSLQKLEHLDLYHNQLSPVGIRALAEGRLENLRALDVGLNNLDLASLRKLITAPVLSKLEYLCLGNNLDASILGVILEESELFALQKLVVFVSDFQPEHIDAFLRASSMPNLEQVHVYTRRSGLASKNFGIPLIPFIEVHPIEEASSRITHAPATSMGPLRKIFEQASRA